MDKLPKLLAVAILLGAIVQGALYGSAWMDDHAFATSVLNTLGDNMTAAQMEGYIRKNAQEKKIPIKDPRT